MTSDLRKVVKGGYYTNGTRLGEVTDVRDTGIVVLTDAYTEEQFTLAIKPFRKDWWLVRLPAGMEVRHAA